MKTPVHVLCDPRTYNAHTTDVLVLPFTVLHVHCTLGCFVNPQYYKIMTISLSTYRFLKTNKKETK